MVAGRNVLALTLIVFALQGCSIQRAQEAEDAKIKLVGMGREQILACMGIPEARAIEGNTEVWRYKSGNGRTDAVSFYNGSGIASGFSERRFCTISLAMTAGKVVSVNYAGPTGGIITKGEQCAFAVENCLK